jgi:uncharacterized membrane protein
VRYGDFARPARSPQGVSLLIAIACVFLAPPLMPFVWATLAPARATYWRARLLQIAVAILVLAALPLLAVIVASALGLTRDPNPNPIGPGLIFTAGVLVSAALALVSVVKTWLALGRDA